MIKNLDNLSIQEKIQLIYLLKAKSELQGLDWQPREYQKQAWDYLCNGGRYAVLIWARRHGKDDLALQWGRQGTQNVVGNYWHMLPEYAQGRKAIWDAVNSHTGKRRIDEAFPLRLRARTNNQEMKITFKNGSTWQVVGSDNYNSLVGSGVRGVVFSEWALANPNAYAYISPILKENKGWAVFITTTRGRNHAFNSLNYALNNEKCFGEVVTADKSGVFTEEELEEIKQEYIDLFGYEYGLAKYEQEYLCSFDAANIGAILARDITIAEQEGRISADIIYEPQHGSIIVSCDIGYRDAATFWFWQVYRDNTGRTKYKVIDCADGWGIKASEWCVKIQIMLAKYRNDLDVIWLPHDGENMSFSAENTAQETFMRAFGAGKVRIVPKSTIFDRVNAGRTTIQHCEFNSIAVAKGLEGLRNWTYKYDDERKNFSDKPEHNWASHYGDGFTYGCQVVRVINKQIITPNYHDLSKMTYNSIANLDFTQESIYNNNRI